MKRLAAVLMLVAGIVAAQTSTPQERFEAIQKRLELSPEQAEQVRPVLVDEFQKLREARDKHSGDTSRRGRMKLAREARGIQEEADKKLKKILSKTQMDEMKKIREEARQQMRDRMGK